MSSPWSPALPEGRTVSLPGRGSVFVREVAGPPGAPVLLLLHGWTATSDLNWYPAFAALGERYRVVAFDHRGHGRGLRPRGRVRIDDCADDAAAVLDALHIERAVVVGYSMGGAVATTLWRRHRDLVEGLVLCATASTFHGSRLEQAQLALLGPIAAGCRLLPRAAAQEVYERLVWQRARRGEHRPWIVDEIRSGHPRMVMEAGAALARFDSRRWFAWFDLPAALVVTTRDTLVPPSRQRDLAARLDAEVFEVDGDHVVCVARPESFVPVLIDACASVVDRVVAWESAS